MKKKQLKIYRKIARNLPEIREGKAGYVALIGHERDKKGNLTGKIIVENRKGIRVNHARRLRRADQRDGLDGMARYLYRVRQFENQTKKLTPLLEQQPQTLTNSNTQTLAHA